VQGVVVSSWNSVRIDGASVLVVGASGGLGRAIARELSERGANLLLHGRDRGRLEALGRELHHPTFVGDLRDPAMARLAVTAATSRHGQLDALVCAVGVVAFGPVAELGDATLEELFAVNVLAPIRLARAALAVLSPGGQIVNVSGIVADQPMAGLAAYSATKAALTAFDTALRRECRASGVHVLDARPPHLETGLADRPIAGASPRLPCGVDPALAAAAIVDAMAADRREVEAYTPV
jgi:cyclic-di-GMP-binding biofilm dispersal mediator protein